MLKIRLQRTGRKNRPAYRVVVCEHTAPVKGKYIEKVGYVDPLQKNCVLNEDRINYWKSVGAKPSQTVESLILKGGKIEQKSRNRLGKRKKAKEAALKAEQEASKAQELEALKAKTEQEEEAKEEKVEESKE